MYVILFRSDSWPDGWYQYVSKSGDLTALWDTFMDLGRGEVSNGVDTSKSIWFTLSRWSDVLSDNDIRVILFQTVGEINELCHAKTTNG